MKKSLLLLIPFLLLLASCAGRGGPVGETADPALAQKTWQAFCARADRAPAPYQDSLSIRFGREGDTRRVTAYMWGNGEQALRLDVMAGVGTTVAMISQQGEHFLIHTPLEGKAYFHEGGRSPLLKVGMPLPFDLFQLDALLHGRYLAVFGSTWSGALTAAKGLTFDLEGGIGGRLTLDGQGLPAAWENDDWKLAMAMDEEGLVRRLDFANGRGEKGIVLVRERGAHERFAESSFKVELPADTQLLPLADYASGR